MTQQKDEWVVGIDLGTTYSSISFFSVNDNQPLIVKTGPGEETIPSHVSMNYLQALNNWHYAVGGAALGAITGPVFYDSKRLIGKNYDEYCENEKEISDWPFSIVEDEKTGNVKMEIQHAIRERGQQRIVNLSFYPEEISAIILNQLLTETSPRLPNHKITKAVVAVPVVFSTQQRQATIRACKLA